MNMSYHTAINVTICPICF